MGHGRQGVGVLAGLAPAVVLLADPAGWYPFGPLKWAAVSVLVPAGLALVWSRHPVRTWRWPTLAAAALVGTMAVAASVGADPLYAWTGTPERRFGVLTWLLCLGALVGGQSLDPEDDGPTMATGLAVAGLGLGLVATAEALGWEPSVLAVDDRLTAALGSAAYLGAAAALLLPAVVGIALDAGLSRRLRAVAAAAVVPLVVALVGSGARAAWFGTAAAATVALVARRHRLRLRRTLAVAAGAGAALVLTLVFVLSPAGSRLGSTFDRDAAGGRSRLDEWAVALRVIGDHAPLGVGPEGYRVSFARSVDEGYERAHGRDPLPDRAHSALLDVAVTGGVGAVAAWSVFLAAVGAAAFRALRSERAWVAGLGAALVAHGAASLLLFPTVELEPLAWLLGGLLVAAARGPGRPSREIVAPRVVPAVLAAVAVVALVAGGVELVADRHARTAAAALRRGDATRAAREAAAAAGLRPDVARYHLLEARAAVAADQGTLAGLAAVDRALVLSPGDPIVLRARAGLLVDRVRATRVPAHAAAARSEITRLLQDDPFNGDLWLQAGAAAELEGDEAGAEGAWSRAERLAPRSPAPGVNLALLYLAQGRWSEAEAALDRAGAIAPEDPRVATARRALDEAR
ncbi:MAG: O-antigen ligase family protein [Acidimicrobiia bacterium]